MTDDRQDIINHLRTLAQCGDDDLGVCGEAADEIVRLRAECERLRKVLKEYAISEIYGERARAALADRPAP